MSLLLQLNGDLPDVFPDHERRLYVLGCRRKPCRRKEGSVRALRAVRASESTTAKTAAKDKSSGQASTKPVVNQGETLFGVKSPTPAQANPFASKSSAPPQANPFSSARPSSEPSLPNRKSPTDDDLPETFAEKARISNPTTVSSTTTPEVWSEDASPYPSYYIDAGKEYLEAEPTTVPSNARLDTEGGNSSAADEKAVFESSMDKTFQQFADRLAQNPEQILRYEFAGQSLLYTKTDAVSKMLSPSTDPKIQTSLSKAGLVLLSALQIPRCSSCGAARAIEMQLTPHAITELEAEEVTTDGMEWGTVIVATCSADCVPQGQVVGEVGYLEEWVGVQWEEVVDPRKP